MPSRWWTQQVYNTRRGAYFLLCTSRVSIEIVDAFVEHHSVFNGHVV